MSDATDICLSCSVRHSHVRVLAEMATERDSLKAQLADAEKAMEAAREYDNPTKERSHWATVSDALAAYDAKWRAGK